jgi:cell division protein FtsL
MMLRWAVALVFLVTISALAVVYTKYRNRVLYVKTQRLERQLEAYEIEWGQLQLEQTTWAEHNRIERLARRRLGLVLPQRDSIVYLKP